ncbi:AMP-binding protein, partial [Undibacterium sp. TJN19]|uniref:AMP-binding protein n=1 Tax=Undibacterium sp. TJN19 TaxID=3413055 RepID=UPI003BF1A8D8
DRLYTETPIAQVYDLYGPSEGTTYSSYVKRQAQGIETIGWPVANTQFYVLSPTGQLLPQGVTGELYIGGIGVARGYLQRPGLTAEKFLPDRFSPQAGSRLYRTGDLVRYLSDGKLEYLGRADHQVKVRGFRIELGEIESTCLQHPGIKDAVVIVREDQPEYRQIVAYLVPHQQTDSTNSTNTSNAALTDSLKASLQKQLPAYMMPSAFVVLPALPLTPNGKLDRAALPVPDGAEQRVGYVAPQGEVEQRVAALWEGLLRRQQVGRFDNFFELGGHSLLVTQLASRIEEAFSIAVNIKIFYKYSTLKDIAARVEKMVALETLADDAIEQMSEEEVAELLSDFEALENN